MNAFDPLLELAGAVEAAELGSPSHFGSPLSEQRALEDGNALVSLSHNGIITVAGVDRLSWLNSMTSQHLLSLEPGVSVETLLLDANGRIERAIRLVDDGERCWLLVDAGDADPLAEFLTRMRFALRVEVANVSADFVAIEAFEGGTAAPALRELQPVVQWRDPWANISIGGVQYAHGEHAGRDWSAVQFVFPRDRFAKVADLVRSKVTGAAGVLSLDALEVRAWRPSRRGDVDERAIPHELDWMRTAVHLTKGCYRGQETVAKVHNLGHPPRRLVMLHLDGSGGELPESGALVFLAGTSTDADARPVGRVTRTALHHEWGGIALALLKRSVAEDAALEVRIGGPESSESVAASQEIIVPGDAGAVNRARIVQQLPKRRV